ncbi:hypothetical protein CAPTEDRAFT_151003 [Capitella teleta]|uniref:Winged helix-turn-helix domain-containing protein n=1 Tax=Capitella teleta TaxID=283909 RepID=R7U9F7_CAPTE|nr:hypothetical protein CAPTEDRAFT_151003 [Capitella teleta]|eukprot:ELU00418.1 hypothetical protein CAPTEDRAFT_151003 [Capitella teleta]
MTPTKSGKTTTIKIAKVRRQQLDETQVAHKAGGQHSGLVINKQGAASQDYGPPQLQLEFKCFLVDQKSGKHVPESRILKFWFSQDTDYLDKVTGAYEFFKELVKPDQFPRDYVGFIKRVMKQVQNPKYLAIKKVDVDLMQLEDQQAPPASPGNSRKEDSRPKETVVQEQLLLTLESAYPNIMPAEDLAQMTGADRGMVENVLQILQGRNLIKEMEPGKWVRKVLDHKTEVKVVKQMPVQMAGQKPTIAIITSKYYEKLAVDAMMEDKTTFVKYKTEGESNVYTIGYIGKHKVVSTKLPAIGRQMAAQISSGNTTTRLLGTFGDIDHVFLVGVSGSVPHYTDFYKHCRLGDVVVATPNDKGFLYIFCDKIVHDADRGEMHYALKSWAPSDLLIQDTSAQLQERARNDPSFAPWETYMREGAEHLSAQEVNFSRPAPETDRLYMNIGGSDIIEVGHPPIPDEAKESYKPGVSQIKTGSVASGKPIVKDDALRMDFAARHSCVTFDTEFDQVLESIVGNRKESFAFVRGICDYLDGTKGVEWQPYAALSAAAYMKTLIENLPAP